MKARHPSGFPNLVYANETGEIIDLPDLLMAGRSGARHRLPDRRELIPLPDGSELFVLPDRLPVGIDPESGAAVRLDVDPFGGDGLARAVAAFVAPAHTSILSAAYARIGRKPATLPLFAYTAVGWRDGRFWAAAFRSDPDRRQDAAGFVQKKIDEVTAKRQDDFPENRLIQHLGRCCLTYGCPAARNYFLGRWEAPLPTSPACNADCVGCISLQTSGCCPATQERISFVPTPDEIAEVAVPHILSAERPVVSFGQGCEGEPLLQAAVIEAAIRIIRRRTRKGTINLNTNASLPESVSRLAEAGLDSMRVSLNSARERIHRLYYRPRGFDFADVKESVRVMKRRGRFVSLNYFILPGFTDDPAETDAFIGLVGELEPDLIQLRNLNMDPDWYYSAVRQKPSGNAIGILAWLDVMKRRFPRLRFGYFNPYLGPQAPSTRLGNEIDR